MYGKVATVATVILLGICSNACATARQSAKSSSTDNAPTITAKQLLQIPAFKAKLEANKPKPTGDALFDRYAAEIWQRHAPAAYISEDDSPPSSLPDSVLAGWEPEFGKDPRYWQLRYSCNNSAKTDSDWGTQVAGAAKQGQLTKPMAETLGAGKAGTFSGADPASYLQHAVDIHSYDLATLDALFLETLKQQEAPTVSGAKYAFNLKEGGAQALLKIADKMVAEFPQESDSWYRRALVQFELSNDAAGLDDLRQGNAAPINRYVTVFPYSVVLNGVIKKQFPGNRYVCGMVCHDLGPFADVRINLEMKEGRRLMADTGQSLDLARWQPVYDYGVRLAEQKGDLALEAQGVLQLSSTLCGDLLVKHPEKFTEVQRQHMWDFSRQFFDRVRRRAYIVENDAVAEKYDDASQLARGLGLPEDKTANTDLSTLRAATALDLSMLSSAVDKGQKVPSDGLKPDLGWALFLIELESTVAQNGDKRDGFITEVDKLRSLDWTKLEFREDPDKTAADAPEKPADQPSGG